MATYIVGEKTNLDIELRINNALTDPTSIALVVLLPNGGVQTFSYPDTVAKLGVGRYRAVVDLTVSGQWTYRWASTGTAQTAARGSFSVRA